MKKRNILLASLLLIGCFLITSNAMAIGVEWQAVDWRAWGRTYDSTGTATNGPNPYDGSSTHTLTPGVYTTPDGSEDAFGVSQVLDIKNIATSNPIWQSGSQEITIFFWGADDVFLDFFTPTVAQLLSIGFKAEVWLDNSPDFDFTQGPSGRSDSLDETFYNTVTDDGTLLLELGGHTLLDTNSNPYEADEIGNAATGAFNGSIYLDVVESGLGLWEDTYNTNTFFPFNSVSGTGADMVLSFSTLPNSAHDWTISGNPTAQADATVIPEPTTLTLLGFGLLGFAGLARRKPTV